jgi:hypothetical protein
MIRMRARPPRAALLVAVVSTWACTRQNPAYLGPAVAPETLEAGVLFQPDAGDWPPDAAPDLAPDLEPPSTPDAAVGLDSTPDRSPPGAALLVVGDLDLSRNDVQLLDALGRMGFALTLKLDVDSTTADAADKEVIIISGSTWPDDVGTKFRDVPVPVVVFDQAMFPTMRMTGDRPGVDFGIIAKEKSIDILDAMNPLAADLSGTVDVSDADIQLSWGVPAPGAARVASQAGMHDHITIFGYEVDAMMVGMPAPARRVGSFVRFARNTTYTEEGMALFEASVRWATKRN